MWGQKGASEHKTHSEAVGSKLTRVFQRERYQARSRKIVDRPKKIPAWPPRTDRDSERAETPAEGASASRPIFRKHGRVSNMCYSGPDFSGYAITTDEHAIMLSYCL